MSTLKCAKQHVSTITDLNIQLHTSTANQTTVKIVTFTTDNRCMVQSKLLLTE